MYEIVNNEAPGYLNDLLPNTVNAASIYNLRNRLNFEIPFVRTGWSGGAKVLGKLSVPGRPTNLEDSRARAYCACSGCGWGCLDIFSLIYLFCFLSPSLWETARYRLKYCLKGPLNPKQPTNQPFVRLCSYKNSFFSVIF